MAEAPLFGPAGAPLEGLQIGPLGATQELNDLPADRERVAQVGDVDEVRRLHVCGDSRIRV
jgi:hypothetical protein